MSMYRPAAENRGVVEQQQRGDSRHAYAESDAEQARDQAPA